MYRNRFIKIADFSALAPKSKFSFVHMVSLNMIEQVLGEQAEVEGIKVFQPMNVASVKSDDTNPGYSNVVFEDGQVVKVRYLIGADGCNTAVSRQLGMESANPSDH